MKHFYFFCTKILILFISGITLGNNYYIDPVDGNDSDDGSSPSLAFKSLYKIDQLSLQPGDTVYFMEGTYQRPGSTLLTINKSGAEGNPITFKNYQNDVPVLEFNGWTGIDIIGGSSYLVFDGLHVKGARTQVNLEAALAQGAGCEANFEGGANGFYNGTGILAVGPNLRWSNGSTNSVPHHITVTNCEIYDCTSSGMAFQQADYVTITNNKVYNNCWYTIYGTSGINMYQFVNVDGTTGFHNTVTNNLMYGNRLDVPQVPFCSFLDGNGLIIDDFQHVQTFNYRDQSIEYDSYNAKTLVANNVAVENGGSGLHFYLSANCYILNNTIVNNASQNEGANGNAELRIGRSTNFVVKNNLIKGDYTIHAVDGNGTIDYSHNYQLGPDISAGFANCEGCIEDVEINFENTNVDASSPYITNYESLVTNAGIQVAEINTDFNKFLRPFNDMFDIGAYELVDDTCEISVWFLDEDEDNFGDEANFIRACTQPEGYVANAEDECPLDPNKIIPGECGCGVEEGTCEEPCDTPLTWYADEDEDGSGNPASSIEACEEPEGYVSNNADNCPTDPTKINSGLCGCGTNEEDCEPCDAPDYDFNAVYENAGSLVVFEGAVYQNEWYSQGDIPTNGNPWAIVDICSGNEMDCSTIVEWSSAAIYDGAGYEVVYEGRVYESKYYISGASPIESDAWRLVAVCSGQDPTLNIHTLSPTLVDDYEVVIYDLAGQALRRFTTQDLNVFFVMNDLKAGLYLINYKNLKTGKTETRKIVTK